MNADSSQPGMMQQARERAQKLLAGLSAERSGIDAFGPGRLSAEQLEQGKQAMDEAIAATRRAIAAIESALPNDRSTL